MEVCDDVGTVVLGCEVGANSEVFCFHHPMATVQLLLHSMI
jgi:hypothetical protein